MISLLEIAERVQTGPKMDEKEWDMAIFKKLNQSAKKCGVIYPGDETYFNMDDNIAQGAFEAAIDWLVEMGVYCITTKRIIKFDRQEILSAIAEAPNETTVGEGRDARIIKQRSYEGDERIGQCPGLHAPFTEDLAPLIVKNYAQIPQGDYLEGFNFPEVDGRMIRGQAMEAYAAKRELSWMREGIRKAGRPGMAIAYYPINTTASSLIAPIDPDCGLRRTDGILLSTLPDVKVEHDMLTAALVYEEYGSFKVNGGGSSNIGGFCGGAEGAAIESIAKTIGGWLVYRDILSCAGAYDIHYTTAKKMKFQPEKVWANSVALQALINNTNTICFGDNASHAAPGTEAHLIELGLMGMQHAINGAHLYMNRQGRAKMNASQTPLESEFQWEIATATVQEGIKRKEGNEIFKKVAPTIVGKEIENGPDHIDECYDLIHHKPKEKYNQIYMHVKKIFNDAGVAL